MYLRQNKKVISAYVRVRYRSYVERVATETEYPQEKGRMKQYDVEIELEKRREGKIKITRSKKARRKTAHKGIHRFAGSQADRWGCNTETT